MTTLNTIIEEEKKLFDQAWLQTGCNSYGVATKGVVKDLHIKLLTTAMQCAYEAGQEERDTYWKERVEELIEKTIQEERFSGAPYALNKLKETITNKDNLK